MVTIIVYVLSALILVKILQYVWPVHSLRYTDIQSFRNLADESPANLKMLDIRDVVDYQVNNVPGSINISLGRLPYVWHKELSPEDSVLILSGSSIKNNRAARILQKQGFKYLYAADKEVTIPKCCHKCCSN